MQGAIKLNPQWQGWRGDGEGSKVLRVIEAEHLKDFDPFLLLDKFCAKLPNGFGDHPHRGFETVTYMRKGAFYHEDFRGHRGTINPGDLQWMTAGKGMVHCEMPNSFDETTQGYQLWINLPAKDKLTDPTYQEHKAAQIPVVQKQGVTVRVISGQWNGRKGPIIVRNPVEYLDIELKAGKEIQIQIKEDGWNSFILIQSGCVKSWENQVKQNEVLRLPSGIKTHKFACQGNETARFLYVSGKKINQPLASHKYLFVMNNQQDAEAAEKDFLEGKNGFEGAVGWKSKISQLEQGVKYEQIYTS